jgi:hypothetical protein
MNLIRRASMRLVAVFLPELDAGACIPSEFCGCLPVNGWNYYVYSNCLGHCTIVRQQCSD